MSLIENKSLTLAENEQFIRAVSVVSTQLNTKARLGAVVETFDPNAIDGDGDGIVQDGTPFERPAVISSIIEGAQRLANIVNKATRLNKQGRAKEYNRRYSGMSAKDIAKDTVPASFKEWAALTYQRMRVINPQLQELNSETTPKQIKDLAGEMEEFVETDLLWMLSEEASKKYKADKLIDKNKAFSELVNKSFDFSPKTVARNRALVEHVLTTNPQFRELVNKHGMPPIFGFGEDMDDSHMANGFFSESLGMGLRQFLKPKAQGRKFDATYRTIGKWWMNGIMPPDVGSKKTKRWTARAGSPEALMIHEYGHYLTEALTPTLTDLDKDERTKKWQAWRFSIGSKWQEVFSDIGSPEWYEKYKLPDNKKRSVIPDEIPHIETAYGESSPTEAFAESISAMFAHNGEDQNLVSQGMKELISDLLSLDPKRDIREQLTPTRTARQIVPDGFASRGAVMEINKEKDARFGEITDPYELTAAVLGTLDGDDPVGKMMRRLQEIIDNPSAPRGYDWWVKANRSWEIDNSINKRVANEKEAELIASVLLNDPAFADMIRRHGMAQIYFSETDLVSGRDKHDVRGVLSGGFSPDDSETGQYWPPSITIDLIGAEHERNLPDQPMDVASAEKIKEYSKGRAPGNVTRTHLSRSDNHVVRHESGHAIHDNLWEKQHRGEITGRRAMLIRAYAKSTWEEFYKEIGRPDLWRNHQRAIGGNEVGNRIFGFLTGDKTASPEIGQVDSAYAWFNPKEMFAESFSAYTSSNSAYRGLLNDTMIDHLQSILGDADTDILEPPPMLKNRDLDTDIPEPPPWEGFASTGEPIKSYSQLRRNWVGAISGNEKFTRREFFANTTTEQKIDLAVPVDEREWALMAWDEQFERLGLTWDQVDEIDLSDPFNPVFPDDYLEEGRDYIEYFSKLMQTRTPDFSPENAQSNREILRATLDAHPRLRTAVERYGLPPIATMSNRDSEQSSIESKLDEAFEKSEAGEKVSQEILDILPAYIKFKENEKHLGDWDKFLKSPEGVKAQKLADPEEIVGGYNPSDATIALTPSVLEAWRDGTRIDHKRSPVAGDWLMGDYSAESVLLHEFAHHIDLGRDTDANTYIDDDSRASFALYLEGERLFAEVDKHIKTEYARTQKVEFIAESIAAVLSGSRDQEEMLSPEARRWARSLAGLPENDPVFAGRTRIPDRPASRYDRFGNWWVKIDDSDWTAVSGGTRSVDGVPDVLETMAEAKLRTGLQPFKTVEFNHSGRKFSIREDADTFSIEINGRTVATANVVEEDRGLPYIKNVDVLPGYTGVAPDKDLYEMIVDHARKKYPSALAPRRARQTEVVSDGFASIGPEHHDARGIDGTPGTPEYTQAIASELAAAKAEGKKVFFDYNGETREVEVTEIFEKNGFTYMKGNDALRDGAERMFRLDRVSMPKRVENPETGAAEVVKKPGKPPRKPVPVFTGKAAELFEGAASWEEVAERLNKGRYVFFDFETTGIEENKFSTEYNHPGTPTQIGLVEIIDGKITRRWSTHVNPGRPMSIDPETGRSWSADNLKYKDPVTGEPVNLTDEWLGQQKPLKDALEEMLEFIGPIEDTILGGQNHPYDDDVMKRAMTDSGLDPARWNPGGFIDSQALAQSLLDKNTEDYPRDPLKGYKTVSLGPLATWLGHDMGGGWHSADADSEASYEAFKRLIDRAALQEGQGITVRRDLFEVGGGEKEFKVRLNDFENQKRGWDWKVKKYQEQQSAPPENPATEGFASRGAGKVRDFIEKRRRAKNPASWKNLTPEQRDAATKASAETAVGFLNGLQDAGVDLGALRNMDRAELDAILKDIIAPGGEARVSDYVTGDGKALIEVSNATMGKVFMSLGFHVQVISDDPNEQYLLENGINDMQKALKDYGAAVAKDPEKLLKDVIFRDWAANFKDKKGNPAPIDVSTIGKEGGMDVGTAAKLFAETFEIDLCLYYKAGSNMLCGANIGIQREEMPQLGGRMKGDDTLAAKAIKTGLMPAKEFSLDKKKLSKLDLEKQKQLKDLANNPAKVAELAKSKDPLAQELFDVLNWNDTEANAESIADKAAEALGIAVDTPRFVDPATMLGAQNQLQGSKVENMADGATSTFLETILNLNNKAIPILDDSAMTDEWIMNKFGVGKDEVPKIRTQIAELRTIAADPARYKELAEKGDKQLMDMAKIIDLQAAADLIKENPAIATPEKIDEYLDYLANVRRHGLFQPTLTAGLPGGQIYMLDGHHRWSGLLMANTKLEDMGLDVRVKLNIKNYQTDIRSGLELGRAIQVAMGVKDAKLAGEEPFMFDPDVPELTPEEFDKAISELVDPAKLIEKIKEVRESNLFRKTEEHDTPGGHAERLAPKIEPINRPILNVLAMTTMPDPEPKSRIKGVKPKKKGYRAAGTGNGWASVEDHINIETERGNELFDTYKEYVDKGYEVTWVTHTPKEAGRYAISADQVNAFERDEISVDPANIDSVDLTGSELVGQDGEGGYLYARRKPSPAARKLRRIIEKEEELLNQYETEGFASMVRTNEALERNKDLFSEEQIYAIDELLIKLSKHPYAKPYKSIDRIPELRDNIEGIFKGDLNIDGKKYKVIVDSYEIADDVNEINLELDINDEYGYLASRAILKLIVKDDGTISIHHEMMTTVGRSRNRGVMTEFLARQEALYREMGVEEITLTAVSNKYMNGVTHWARNGYDFANHEARLNFIEGDIGTDQTGLRGGLDEHRDLFSDEEYDRLTNLLDDNSATALELTDFEQAETYFKITKPYVYMSRKLKPEPKRRKRELVGASSGFASTGRSSRDGFASIPITQGYQILDIVQTGNNIESNQRGGSKQRDRKVIDDDFYTRQQKRIAGVRVPEYKNDENSTPTPGSPIYRETLKISGRKYTFEVDSDGIISVYTGRNYKQVAQLTLDRGHTHIGGRSENKNRHYIDGITVGKKHRRRGIATEMSKAAEHAYGGRIEHSTALTEAGEAWRNADVKKRGTPAARISSDGFASRGSKDRPKRKPGDKPSGFGIGSSSPKDEPDWLDGPEDWLDEPGDYDGFASMFLPVMLGATAVINSSTGKRGRTPGEERTITDRQYRARDNIKYQYRELRDLNIDLASARDVDESNKIQARISHLENRIEAMKIESNLDRLRGVLVKKEYRKAYEKVSKSIEKSDLDSQTKQSMNSIIRAMLEAQEFGDLDYNGVSDSLEELTKNGYGNVALRAVDELQTLKMLTPKQFKSLRGQLKLSDNGDPEASEASEAFDVFTNAVKDLNKRIEFSFSQSANPAQQGTMKEPGDGFASRGSITLNRAAKRIAEREAAKSPGQMIGEEYLDARLDGYHKFGGNVSNAELNMLAIYKSWQESNEPWESFVERFPALQSMIKAEESRLERAATISILEEMISTRRGPQPTMTAGQREGTIRRVNNPQIGAANLMAESVIDTRKLKQQQRDLKIQKNYLAWQRSGNTWEKFVEDNPAIEKLVEKERSSGKMDERIIGLRDSGYPPLLDDGSSADFSLDELADKLGLDEIETGTDRVMGQITGQINQRIANGEATLAEKLGITPEQLRERLADAASEINEFVDRFVHDKDVRRNVKHGLKILSAVSVLLGSTKMKELLALMNPTVAGSGQGSEASSLLDLVDHVLSAGIHEALIAYGGNFANLIATEFAAMRLVTRQRAKEMIKEIKERIEGTGQYIGTMSNEMWARLRGAWAKVRPTAPIGVPAAAKQWIIAGSSPQWAEMSWMDYQSKSRLSRDLIPTDTQRWTKIAVKVGQSPELIDIASYRAGIGYGDKRIKSRDVIRVHMIAEKAAEQITGQTIGEMSAYQSTASGQEIDGDGDGFVATLPGGPDDTPVRQQEPKPLGQLEKGNIDLTNRPTVRNSDGSVSTVRSITINEGKTAVLIPSVIRKPDGTGKVVSVDQAIRHYKRTGEHLGKFDNVNNANSYAEQLHKDQAKRYAADPRVARIMARTN